MKYTNSLDVLKQVFGYDEFREGQKQVIDSIVSGQDALVFMPTGSGKSLCYQIPALIREGVAVVISPLISLMEDQVLKLQLRGVKAACLNSNLSVDTQSAVYHQLQNGALDLLYMAPERLLMTSTLNVLSSVKIALFAIDEVHCVSAWGHDFRPEYLGLDILHQKWPNVPRVALTATSTPKTTQEVKSRLFLQNAKQFTLNFDRPNIDYLVEEKTDEKSQLLTFLSQHYRQETGIIYCHSRSKVERIVDILKQNGYHALAYHAGLDPEERREVYQAFVQETRIIIVATVAFGMGVSKPDVRFVAHLGLPKTLEHYYQETGRAGRDGQPAIAWLLYSLGDVAQQWYWLEVSELSSERKAYAKSAFMAMLGFCNTEQCRRGYLLNYFGQSYSQSNCAHCDLCQTPRRVMNGTIAAQKVLSLIYWLQKNYQKTYGASFLIQLLQGKKTKKVLEQGYDKISTFGKGQEFDVMTWSALIRHLFFSGFVGMDEHKTLYLLDKSLSILRKAEEVWFCPPIYASKNSLPAFYAYDLGFNDDQKCLQLRLMEWRSQIAHKEGVPPHLILETNILNDIVLMNPHTLSDLRGISGVGQLWVTRYGESLMQVLRLSNDF